MEAFTDMEMKNEAIGGDQFLLAVLSFFSIALGSLFVGVIIGLFTALFTKAQCARDLKKVPLIRNCDINDECTYQSLKSVFNVDKNWLFFLSSLSY